MWTDGELEGGKKKKLLIINIQSWDNIYWMPYFTDLILLDFCSM